MVSQMLIMRCGNISLALVSYHEHYLPASPIVTWLFFQLASASPTGTIIHQSENLIKWRRRSKILCIFVAAAGLHWMITFTSHALNRVAFRFVGDKPFLFSFWFDINKQGTETSKEKLGLYLRAIHFHEQSFWASSLYCKGAILLGVPIIRVGDLALMGDYI